MTLVFFGLFPLTPQSDYSVTYLKAYWMDWHNTGVHGVQRMNHDDLLSSRQQWTKHPNADG